MTIALTALTEGAVAGNGVFDKLMATVKVHLAGEFQQGRITGPEYTTVYLGAMTAVMNASLEFLLKKDQVEKEVELLQAQIDKITAEIALTDAQKLMVDAQTAFEEQKKLNLEAEALNIPKQGEKLDKEVDVLAQQNLKLIEETSLVTQQTANTLAEHEVIEKTICKLEAEYDVLMETKLKTIQETGLLSQKKVTEQAQVSGTGVDSDSVIGKQKALYTAQIDGFAQDARQKAARIIVDTWNVRRTTDEDTQANSTNKLDDATLGSVIAQLINGLPA